MNAQTRSTRFFRGFSALIAWIIFVEGVFAFQAKAPLAAGGFPQTPVSGSVAAALDLQSDSDPYFLGSQRWDSVEQERDSGNSGDPNGSLLDSKNDLAGSLAKTRESDQVTGFTGSPHSITLSVAGRRWTISQPLVELGSAQDWVFFAPRAQSSLDENGAQGLYFVRKSELFSAAVSGASVPFFYLPLPSQAHEYAFATPEDAPVIVDLAERGVILVRDRSGIAFTVKAQDILGHEQWASLTLEWVNQVEQEHQVDWLQSEAGQRALDPIRMRLWDEVASEARSATPERLAELPLEFITRLRAAAQVLLPPRWQSDKLPAHSTALHGLVPVNRYWEFSRAPRGAYGLLKKVLLDPLRELVLPQAWAGDPNELVVAAKIALMLANCGVFYTTGILLKHTLMKSRAAEVQYFVLHTAVTNVNLILDELIQRVSSGGLSAGAVKKAQKVLSSIQAQIPALLTKRDEQLARTAARAGKPSSTHKLILGEWILLEQKLVTAQSALIANSGSSQFWRSAETKAADADLMSKLSMLKSNFKKSSGQGLEIKTNVGLFGHVLTLVAQFTNIFGGNVLRYVMDRAHLAEHNLVRKFFEKTFGFTQRTSDRTPVNDKTVYLGAGVQNVVDTSLVGVQLFGTNAPFARLFAALIPNEWAKSQIQKAFSAENQSTADYNFITLVANLASYIATGAYGVAHDQQEILTQIYEREVKREIKERGIEPDSAEGLAILKTEPRVRVRQALLMKGFPTEEEFFFDANSAYESLQKRVGYVEPAGAGSHDHAAVRPGRVRQALEKAIAAAQASGDRVVAERLEGLKHDLQLRTLFAGFDAPLARDVGIERVDDPTTPAMAWQRFREARRVAVALTLPRSTLVEGGAIAQVLTPRFGDLSASQRAADLVRTHWEDLLDPQKKDSDKNIVDRFLDLFRDSAEERHKKEMDLEHGGSFFSRWQIGRAAESADLALAQAIRQKKFSEDAVVSAQEQQDFWRAHFRDALVAKMGLSVLKELDQVQLLEKVEIRVQEAWKDRLNHAGFREYFAALTPTQQHRLRGIYEADFFSSAYTDLTMNKKYVPALSPLQPGVFQKLLRQRAWFQKSRALTFSARIAEGFFSMTQYRLGFLPQLYRVVPAIESCLVLSPARSLRRLPPAIAFGMPWSFLVWGNAYTPSLFLLNFLVSAVTVGGPWGLVTQAMDNGGVKQGSTVSGMALFTFIGSWVTWTGMLVTPILNPLVAPYLRPIDAFYEKVGFVQKDLDPETGTSRFVVRQHPALEKCKDLLRPVVTKIKGGEGD